MAEQGGTCGGVWRDEEEKGNDVIILILKKLKIILK